MVDFNAIEVQEKNFGMMVLETPLEEWKSVFGFEYDEDLKPIEPKSCLPEPKEGVYRTEFDKIYSKPKPNPYKGLNEKDKKYVFEFTEPIWPNDHAHICHNFSFGQVRIDKYPPYIYSTFKISPAVYDQDWVNAINELEAIVTMGDMNGVYKKEGAGNINDGLFYLSFLKSQVMVMPLNAAFIKNAQLKEGAISIDDHGVYCPCYDFAGCIRPAVLLDLNAIRAYAKNEQKDLKEMYKRTLLKLFAYAYQDPTNTIDETGAFVKKDWNPSFSYDEQEANEFVKKYLP